MPNIYSADLRSCYGCKHYEQAYSDPDNGDSAPDYCNAALDLNANGECSEGVAMLLQSVLFQFSVLNNCPLRQEKAQRRSITSTSVKMEIE